jgi:hypothetical protein
MRRPVDRERLGRFMRSLGQDVAADLRVYLTGGATAVLYGWRASTVDVDLKAEPDDDRLYRALPALKERLEINVELASPDQFIPELPGWRERSPFIAREGRLSFYHYDPCAQALSKIQRSHAQDLADVGELIARGLVTREDLRRRFAEIEPQLYRYPAIDPVAFRRAVDDVAGATPAAPAAP